MANKKKFNNPVQIGFRAERSTKDRIDAITENQTAWLNKAILNQLKRDEG